MKIYRRKILSKIEKTLRIPEIIVIHGARQTGKTTILQSISSQLKDRISPANIVYFDLEDFELVDLCNLGVRSVIDHLRSIGCDFNKKIYFLIDEIQYLENPSSFLKFFYDHWKGKVKLIVSGSSSFAIKSKFKDSLVGRTIDFELFGLDFDEFLIFKNLSFDLKSQDKLVIKELNKLYKEFIRFGFYPRIVLEPSIAIKEQLLKQIINTYIKKDIKDLAKIGDINKFNKLLKILASQSGSLVNRLELANTVAIARPTLDNYLTVLENTYIIKLINPFFRNRRSELTKMPKVYFEDLGIKSILEKGNFSTVISGQDLETAVFSQLRKKREGENLHYWRTAGGQEIDFIIENPREIKAIEVKINVRNKDKLVLTKFARNYSRVETYLTGLNFIDKKKYLGKVKFIYPWQI